MPTIQVKKETIEFLNARPQSAGLHSQSATLNADGSYSMWVEPSILHKLDSTMEMGETWDDCIKAFFTSLEK